MFLRSLDLNPLEWSTLVAATEKPNPYIGEVIAKGFELAQAAVVLATPDDEARLKIDLRKPDDRDWETELTGQPRQNVLFEAGMALGSHEDRTVLVELGRLRPMSDTLGRHVVKISNTAEARQELANRLQTARCAVQLSGTDWQSEGDFEAAIAADTVPDKPDDVPDGKNPEVLNADAESSSHPTAADFVNLGEHLWYLSNPPRAPVGNIAKAIRGFLNQLTTCKMSTTRSEATLLAELRLAYSLRTNLIADESLQQIEAMMESIRRALETEAKGKNVH